MQSQGCGRAGQQLQLVGRRRWWRFAGEDGVDQLPKLSRAGRSLWERDSGAKDWVLLCGGGGGAAPCVPDVRPEEWGLP